MDQLQDVKASHLTDRELEILNLVVRGMSAKEIAQVLSIAPKTVERHIDHVRMKTRTRNRIHMVAHAFQQGLVH